MRILMLHNRYLVTGGEEQATSADVALLREYGHEVELLEHDNREITGIGRARTALGTIWSNDSYGRVLSVLEKTRFDVMHVQNFFPLWSPSVYYAAARARVPVVQTLHNYRLLCVNALLYRDHRVCEDCLDKSFPWPGILHSCYRGSWAESSVVATMIGVHRLLKSWKNKVEIYIAVSEFARRKYMAAGIPAYRIAVRPNFVHPNPSCGTGGGGYALYAGRLSPEKSIATLLEAWRTADRPVPLKVVGDGPLTRELVAAAEKNPGIEYLGKKSQEEVLDLMRRAEFLVFPSNWYETQGRTIIESFAVGTPVLSSALGERAAMVVPGRNGFLFPAGDTAELRRQVEWCSQNLPAVRSMRSAARATFEDKFTGPTNHDLLIKIYRQAQQQPSS
jgi:glycosyltransferase involved in cell wall biosynthesis